MTTQRSDWDAIVVGGGLGGLTSAAYLAASGRKVLVLEQHDWAGGNSHVFRRRRKYEFDVGVHYLGDCGEDGIIPTVLRGLGADGRVEFHQLNPDGFDKIVMPGLTFDVPSNWDEFQRRLETTFPEEVEGIREYVEVVRATGGEQHFALGWAPDMPFEEIMEGTQYLQGWGWHKLVTLFDHCKLSTRLRTVLAAQSPNYGLGPTEVSVATHSMITDHYIRGAYHPVGGGQMIAATLTEVLEAHGGEMRTNSQVDRIQVVDNVVTGVALADGTELTAPLVISNADYRRTILDLVGAEHFAPELVRDTKEASMGLPFATVYVALDRELDTRPEDANMWWYAGDDIEHLYESLHNDGQPEEIKHLFISFASRKDNDSRHMHPKGHSTFQLITLCPPGYAGWGVENGPADGEKYRRNPDYLAEKERFTEAVVKAGERALGPFRDSIVHLEMASPLTQERYTRSTGGTPFGMAKWGDAGQRPVFETGVGGLYVVGQSTQFGSGITGVMAGGMVCAGQIMGRPLLFGEVSKGSVVGNRELLPERPAGWDPVAVSRGAARADARGLATLA
ncbi:phytoene desaturase family protein [Umezawaea endophytica]|uniref:NAD(P)/FAD-dependent oxidoreductase n=1 Tax=Umezawaea endophytica TaxID=1654476 RepID=A0A9X3AES7_9PSEU|nr:NAD(P)/FAD-dependent oxidoreductase [Umezawaea endophytica]MCS7477286.1 NAD(P)/FAD-dependent oxidoreductase [Umezawaea endophytica]